MRYSAAYLLAVLGGNPSPKVSDVSKIICSVGIQCDEKRAQQVIDACKGKNLDELLAEGMKKIDNLGSVTTCATTMETAENQSEATSSAEKPAAQKQKEPSPPSSDDEEGVGGLFD